MHSGIENNLKITLFTVLLIFCILFTGKSLELLLLFYASACSHHMFVGYRWGLSDSKSPQISGILTSIPTIDTISFVPQMFNSLMSPPLFWTRMQVLQLLWAQPKHRSAYFSFKLRFWHVFRFLSSPLWLSHGHSVIDIIYTLIFLLPFSPSPRHRSHSG